MDEKKNDCTKINTHGYVIPKSRINEKTLEKIKNELTFQGKNFMGRENENSKRELFRESELEICVPRYWGIKKWGPPDNYYLKNNNYFEKFDNFVFTGQLRPAQVEIMKIIEPKIFSEGGGLLLLNCAQGKTILMCYIACLLGMKVLYMTHIDDLSKQGMEKFKKFTNIRKFGTIDKNGVNIDEGTEIVFASIQSLMNFEKYDRSIFSRFGVIFIDECHHIAAPRFLNVLKNLSVRHMIFVSASYKRNDGLFDLIKEYAGDILYQGPKIIPRKNAYVIKIYFECNNFEKTKNLRMNKGKLPNTPGMTSNIAKMNRRNKFIAYLLRELYEVKIRKTLCISKRKIQINEIAKLLDDEYNDEYGIIIGKSSKKDDEITIKSDDLKVVRKKRIILGIIQKAEEGLDIEGLNTLIYGCEISDPCQSSGRIFREEVYETPRIIFDIVDTFDKYYLSKSKTRDEFYKVSEMQIYYCNVTTDNTCEDVNTKMYDDLKFIYALANLDLSVCKKQE